MLEHSLDEKPHMKDIQHVIDLAPRSQSPNFPHYRMDPMDKDKFNS